MDRSYNVLKLELQESFCLKTLESLQVVMTDFPLETDMEMGSFMPFDTFRHQVSKFFSDRVFIAGMLKQWLVKSFNFTPLVCLCSKGRTQEGVLRRNEDQFLF